MFDNVAPIRDILEHWISKYKAYWSHTLLRVRDDVESKFYDGKKSKEKRRKA